MPVAEQRVKIDFPGIEDALHNAADASRAATIIGDGSTILRVSKVPCPNKPGRTQSLVRLDYVKCGSTIIEKQETRKILVRNPNITEDIVHQQLRLAELPDGTRVVERANTTGFGKWQEGAKWQVVGDWELDPEEKPENKGK